MAKSIRQYAHAVFAFSFCIGMASSADAQVVDHQSPGNLRPGHKLSCIDLADAESGYTPADLYPAVAACIVDKRMVAAVDLMALAGAYGRFDRQRVADASAHQATTVLQMQAYADLSDGQRQAFMKVLEHEAADPVAERRRCGQISRLGAPAYRPDYMIQHGMGAFIGGPGDGLVPGFDPVAAWAQVRTAYLHCLPAS